jgi:antitoxin ParD1/3/4
LAGFANRDILALSRNARKDERMPTRNIILTEHYNQFVAEQVHAGKQKNVSEVLRAGLRLLEEQTQTEEQKLILLRKLAGDGFRSLDQGPGLAVSSASEVRTAIATIGRQAAKGNQTRQAE